MFIETPSERGRRILLRISASRIIYKNEWAALAEKIALKVSHNPSHTAKAIGPNWNWALHFSNWFLYRRRIVLWSIPKWDELEEEARKEGLQFCLIRDRMKRRELQLLRETDESEKLRKYINRIKMEIREYV